jgi:hypothetical protein
MSGGIINTLVSTKVNETTVYGVDVYLGFMQLEGLDSKQHIVSLQIVIRMENTNRWKISSIAFR